MRRSASPGAGPAWFVARRDLVRTRRPWPFPPSATARRRAGRRPCLRALPAGDLFPTPLAPGPPPQGPWPPAPPACASPRRRRARRENDPPCPPRGLGLALAARRSATPRPSPRPCRRRGPPVLGSAVGETLGPSLARTPLRPRVR